ncbi:hypothetical protein NGM10_17050 (plasmid) [Halorussus salilacus]|uniref:hypothetical protein n=1 Tax=Halorussus salilacus TaxID=2953750 RepID=UPI00209F510A|nr:hypothetical protein [Halorussus salilacus]USZ69803.1 hypothetical protein NGM10_17050 [Halorussus salilacus]
MAGNWRRFAVLFGATVLLFASIVGVVATVEHDRRCQLSEVRDSPGGESVEYYYSELNAAQQDLFDRMRSNPDRRFEGEACVDGTVRDDDRYYVVEQTRTIVWANPAMLVALAGFVGAVGIISALVRREMRSRPW